MRRLLLWMPVVLFAGLFGVVGLGWLKPADPVIAAKDLPPLTLNALVPGKPGIEGRVYGAGQLRVINLFASWCVPCVAEAPQLAQLKAAGVPVDGIAVADTTPAVTAFLTRNGDPYARIGDDPKRQAMKLLGASGVPETYVVDGQGRIVRRYVSNLQPDQVAEIIALSKAAR